MTTDEIMHEIAHELKHTPNLSMYWVRQKYKLTKSEARVLINRARADLKNYPQNYEPIDYEWEQTALVPEQHLFNWKNLYSDWETVETVGNYEHNR